MTNEQIEIIRKERDMLTAAHRLWVEYPNDKKNPSKREQARMLGQLQAYNHVLRMIDEADSGVA